MAYYRIFFTDDYDPIVAAELRRNTGGADHAEEHVAAPVWSRLRLLPTFWASRLVLLLRRRRPE